MTVTETDHELLTWAALAAGIEFGMIHGAPRMKCDSGWTPWNPLDDDGDAHRLAVRLKICIDHDLVYVAIHRHQGYTEGVYEEGVKAWIVLTSSGELLELDEVYNAKPDAATRRAIVKLAAELGRRVK